MTLPRVVKRRPARLSACAAALLAAAVVLASCETGAYPVDLFPEMHYQASYRTQEPSHPGAPEGSVPTTGAEIPVTDFAATLVMENPVPFDGPSIEAGRDLFETNCAMCHGANADGVSYVAAAFEKYQEKAPPSLLREELAALPDGSLFWTISQGVNLMPSFQPLLTAEERWAIINYLRSVQR